MTDPSAEFFIHGIFFLAFADTVDLAKPILPGFATHRPGAFGENTQAAALMASSGK